MFPRRGFRLYIPLIIIGVAVIGALVWRMVG